MEVLSTATIPRLRISRNHQAYERSFAGSSRDHLTDVAGNATPTEDMDGNDRDDDQESTPRMNYKASISDADETPAARLRALLARTPVSPKSTPMPHPPSQFSDKESDFDPLENLYQSTRSTARESLKDIFSRALRDPGNTPQKGGIKPRRNSVDTSEVEASPRVQRQKAQNRSNRKSLSDEEVDPARLSEASFRSSQAATFDILRERLMSSHSQLKDLHLSDSMYQDSITDNDNDTAAFLRDMNPSTTTPPAATSTPQQSLRMSIDSHLPSHSNLLDHDSEMHRAFEGFDSYDAEESGQRATLPPATPQEPQKRPLSRQTSRIAESFLTPQTLSPRIAQDTGTGTENKTHQQILPTWISHSTLGGTLHNDDHSLLHEREREWGRPRTPASTRIPNPPRQSLHLPFPRGGSPVAGSSSGHLQRGSNISPHRFDDHSSGGSSLGSQADHRERVGELERERNIERERDWNKPRPSSSRPTSSLGFHSPVAAERSRTRSLDPLASPARHLHHHHSSTDSSRTSSPAGSLNGGLHEDEEEIVHERERNWNAPHPKWTHGSPRPASPLKTHLPSIRVRGESLTTRNGEMHAHSSSSVDGNYESTTAPTRAISPLHSAHTSASPSFHHNHTHSSNHLPHQPAVPRSPSRPASAIKGKGKARVVDESSASSLVDSLSQDASPHASSLMMKSGVNPGSFVKNRASLAPFKPDREIPERKSPSPAGKSALKPSSIPVRSPKKSKPSTKSNPQPNSSTKASFSTPSVRSDYLKDERHDASTEDEEPSREQTLKMEHTLPLALGTPEYTPPRSPSPSFPQNGLLIQSKTPPQPKPDTSGSIPSMDHMLKTPDQPLLQELSPPPSPPTHSSLRDSYVASASFMSTPPRRLSFNASQVEFQTPSPPKNMPNLPGPPTSSEDETDEEFARTPLGSPRSNLTSMKTPRPPGAWASTPVPRAVASSKYDSMESHPEIPVRDHAANSTVTKTPRPPGAWASTPAPPSPRELPPENAHFPVETEEEYDSGLATPVASFSKGSSLNVKTPAPPGAWMATPAVRKSLQQVRFVNGSATMDSTREPLEDVTNTSSQIDHPSRAALPSLDVPPRAHTPELNTPISPVSRRTPSHKSPGIRVLDAFGREVIKDGAMHKSGSPPKNRSGIRIVDAMGRKVEKNEELPQTSVGDVSELSLPLKHGEALVRVRQGLADLVNGLDEMDKQADSLDYDRVKELQQASTAARTARAQVNEAISSNSADLNNKLQPLRASMKKSKVFFSSTTGRRWQTSWIFWFALITQLLLVIIIYRVTTTRARDLFLTTYYDPFFPDLHLYTSRPDTLRLCIQSSSGWSWFTIRDTLHREGWIASSRLVWDKLSILAWDWQQSLWQNFGAEAASQTSNWPPT